MINMMNSTDVLNVIHVAVGIVRDEVGRILISKRADHLHQGGKWEFPGGKVEAGETVFQALQRELQEELGVQVEAAQPLIQIPHEYKTRTVLLDVWEVQSWQGEATGREGQEIHWIALDEINLAQFPAADAPILTALQLPDRYLITGDADNEAQFLKKLKRALKQGIRLVQLRAKSLDLHHYAQLAVVTKAMAAHYGAKVMINGAPEWVNCLGVDGVHLTAQRLFELSERPLAAHKWVSASCHSVQELEQAQKVGIDFAVLSPVQPTKTHPDAAALGWEKFAEWIAKVPFPVYALGGVGTADIMQAKMCGAQGTAAIRAFWGDVE